MPKEQITVTKPYVPAKRRLYKYLDRAVDGRWLTNDGPLVRELKDRLEDHLGVDNLLLVANGTLGILIAMKVAQVSKLLTTPFSFPATSSAPVWANVKVCYSDIDPVTYNMVPSLEPNLENVDGVLPTHVYGNPCDLEGMDRLSKNWDVPLIYDAAHAFGVGVNGDSVLDYGDMSILSFHATKMFHCVEGGAIRFTQEDHYHLAKEMINFGYSDYQIQSVGINAKMNEFEAAMGLAVLDDIDSIAAGYRTCYELYDELLDERLQRQTIASNVDYNYSYFSVIFPELEMLKQVVEALNENNVFPRQYFSPSLDEILVYGEHPPCEVSREVAGKILCLPIYSDLSEKCVREISEIVNSNLDT